MKTKSEGLPFTTTRGCGGGVYDFYGMYVCTCVCMVPLNCSPSSVNTSKAKGGMSNDDFVRYMEGLQDSRNIVADPSRSVSLATYDVRSKGMTIFEQVEKIVFFISYLNLIC